MNGKMRVNFSAFSTRSLTLFYVSQLLLNASVAAVVVVVVVMAFIVIFHHNLWFKCVAKKQDYT